MSRTEITLDLSSSTRSTFSNRLHRLTLKMRGRTCICSITAPQGVRPKNLSVTSRSTTCLKWPAPCCMALRLLISIAPRGSTYPTRTPSKTKELPSPIQAKITPATLHLRGKNRGTWNIPSLTLLCLTILLLTILSLSNLVPKNWVTSNRVLSK